MALKRIDFEDATIIKDAYVNINGVEYTLIPAQTSGGKDLNKATFDELQDNIEDAIEESVAEIIESGSNANGSWIKWSNGTMICRQTIPTGDVALNTTWGSLYVHSNTDNHNFPQAFIEKPEVHVTTGTVNNSMGYWLGDYGNRHITNEYWRGWCLIRPNSATVNTELFVLAIGKWK